MITRRDAMIGAGAVASLLGAGQAWSAEAPGYRGEDFFRPRTTSDAALSPSGTRMAVLHADKQGQVLQSYMDIVDVAQPAQPPKRIPLGNHEASTVMWANEHRLLIWVTYNVAPKGMPDEFIRRAISIQDDGSQPVLLFENRGKAVFYVHDLGQLIDDLPDDPDNVLMAAFDMQREYPTLYRVDVNTGAATVVEYGGPRTLRWFTQDGVAMVRLDGGSDETVIKVLARAPGESDWKNVRTLKMGQTRDFELFGAAAEPGVFYVSARLEGEETVSVREFDVRTLKYGPPLLPRPGLDVTAVSLDRQNRLRSAMYAGDRPVYTFADPDMPAHLAAMETYFGGDKGIRFIEADRARRRYIGLASGPQEPGVYFLYDKATHQIVEIGRARANLAPDRLGAMEILSIRTRDGQSITAYLTSPAGRRPGPLMVLPHGGPELRDHFAYDPWVQTLAAQGWWVLQPNFRGSGGYGETFAKAGWTHWGDRMQEDVEDAVQFALAQRGLDAGRVAILGASYGGYAALMGPIRRPDLYKAAVSIAGVSDLPDMLAWTERNDDSPDRYGVNFWRARMGDPVKDQARLVQASPRRRAAELKIPVMIAHGSGDQVVPVHQARNMAAALKEAGRPCDYYEVKRLGHPDWPDNQQAELMNRCVAFLARYLA